VGHSEFTVLHAFEQAPRRPVQAVVAVSFGDSFGQEPQYALDGAALVHDRGVPQRLITRDAAVVALLKYEQALEDRGGTDPVAVAARSEVRKLIRRLLSLTPTPAALEWMRGSTQQLTSALEADQDGAD
jgi:hypothetical protein